MDWTEDQVTILLYEYCRRPFGQFSSTKQFVKDLGALLHRTPGAIVRKAGNLAHYDPQMSKRGVGGLSHTAKVDAIIWNKYYNHWDSLALDAETLIARLQEKPLEESVEINLQDLPEGKERIQEIKKRVNQDFFRKCVLVSYKNACCITGFNNPQLLEASHIVEWSVDERNRINPENGLCLNTLLHKAYDKNLIGISPDYEILISDKFWGERIDKVDNSTRTYFNSFNHTKLRLPNRFLPNKDFLALHFERYKKEL